jgi:hypothetical protein
MPGCAPGHDAIKGRPIRVTLDSDSLTLVAKKVGMTKHGYINANPDTIFEVWFPRYEVFIVYNDGPSYIYELQTH